MVDLYEPTSPYDQGFLDTGDGNRVHYEQLGNPVGKPAVHVHGGPGGGTAQRPTQAWDPERYRLVRFDQRNCGRSTPHASDPAADMSLNTTQHLIDDMERLREHLGIDKWLVNGASWGSTLGLAYAQQHPERVTEIVIQAVTTSSPAELDWLYRGAGRFHPEAWDRFRDGVPEDERDGDLLAAYARLMENPDRAIREKAAADWLTWEDAVISHEPNGSPGMYSDRDVDAQIGFVRICSHIFSNGAWLEKDQILRDAHKLAGIPGVLVHGRHDMGCPPQTAWELAKAWPDARLHIFDDSGHVGGEAMKHTVRAALEEFKNR
ncbi:prolyl aminopeptidase [Streptomyces sp. PTM05]|uniref:Proline iminopeptidase n=1 Tax=Streptantibioticus parmotrematis TaxID=2873249 RepID=A0ABS7QZF2_9ACTN|nr:prolyl aminopeptidase [Streptantibioticus parmotrematis]MBY8888034.1 prolyl aminopeptidase [Streptantibioticus parmotrematis]